MVILNKYNKIKTASVTLSGRTLYKDGSWNTLCLPFSLGSLEGTPLAGATVKTLESASFDKGTLTLNFSEENLTSIEAGKPYIVKWTRPDPYVPYEGPATENCSDIVNPVFNNVTISNVVDDITPNTTGGNTGDTSSDGWVTFHGTFSPYAIEGEDRSMLFLGSNNTLYYPSAAMTIGACRAYFQLNNGITASPNPSQGEESDPPSPNSEGGESLGVRAFQLNFGDDTNGIADAEANSSLSTLNSQLKDWYFLDGRKLNGKPTTKGLYLHHGRKVVIK